jgi:peptidoglycan L-alanyl-D-glutamate endopeptidase CwlK
MDKITIIRKIQQLLGVHPDGDDGIITWSALFMRIIQQDPGSMDRVSMIKSVQEQLGLAVDGVAGEKTWNDIHEFFFPETDTSVLISADTSADTVDERSEKVISLLEAPVKPLARALVRKAAEAGITIKIISGLRTFEEQDKLFNSRTANGGIVTKARGGFSNHNFGLAFDVGVFVRNKYQPESPKYDKLGPIGKKLGLSWGGDWKSIVDKPHFELRPAWAANLSERKMIDELRRRHNAGLDLFA